MILEPDRIYKGCCLELMRRIPSGSIDMVLCDLPYGTTANKWDAVIPLTLLWAEYNRIIKEEGAIVLTASQPFTSLLITSNIRNFRYSLVWNKKLSTGFLNAKKQPLRSHEDILVFYKKQPTYNPQFFYKKDKRKTKGMLVKPHTPNYGKQKNYISTADDHRCYPLSIITIPQVRGNSLEKVKHPTQKPLELFEYLIKTYSKENDLVLDNCLGSGTTAVACVNTNRRYIGIEKEDAYYEIAKERVLEAETINLL